MASPDPAAAPAQTGLAPAAARPAPTVAGPPQLLIAIVFDQLSSETLSRSLPALRQDGLFWTAILSGTYFERGVYPYINTLTAPGHAAIFTGAPPRTSGIGGNEEWDEVAEAAVPMVDSPGHRVFGHDSETVGPARLRQRTVAQMLREQTSGRAKVVSLSLKDRAAVFSVGPAPDLALWFDSAIGRFTTSSFCVDSIPSWVTEYEKANPISEALLPWHAQEPMLYESLLGPDAAVGEDSWWGATFPHDPKTTSEPLKTARFLPALSEYLVDLARRASVEYALGDDEVPDLLVISISGTDYVGHTFGPHSWEYLDHLRRADAALGKLVAGLSSSHRTSVMITSDHGVAPLPEHSKAAGHDAGRLFTTLMQPELEKHLDARVGEEEWVATILSGFVFFTPESRKRADYGAAIEAAREHLLGMDGVHQVHSADEAAAWASSADPAQRVVANSFPEGTHADLLIDTRPYWVFGFGAPPGSGTHHGSRQPYDQEVPLLFFGPGIAQRRLAQPVSQLSIAATLAELLGVPAPPGAQGPPLALEK